MGRQLVHEQDVPLFHRQGDSILLGQVTAVLPVDLLPLVNAGANLHAAVLFVHVDQRQPHGQLQNVMRFLRREDGILMETDVFPRHFGSHV